MRVGLSTRAETVLFDEPAAQLSSSTCSPDGRFIAYQTPGVIKVRDTRNGTTSELRSAVPIVSAPAVSLDGTRVAYVGVNSQGAALYVGPASGTEVRRVTQVRELGSIFLAPAVAVSWSPDSRFLYYSRRERVDAPWELYVVSVDGGEERKVGLTGVDVRDVTVSPDGTQLAFSAGPQRRPEIAVIENFLPELK